MTLLCNYQTDLNIIQRFVKPVIKGIDLITGEPISSLKILNIISPYIEKDLFFEKNVKEGCSFLKKKRKLKLQINNKLIELEYPKPFINLNWNLFNQQNIKVETIPEILQDWYLKHLIK